MICKNCGAIIKQGEDYCRKCGSLVVSFKDKENSSLKYICIENNLKGKFLSIINKLRGTDKKEHNIENVQKSNRKNLSQINFTEIKNNISKQLNDYIDENGLRDDDKPSQKSTMDLITDAINKLNKQ